MIKHPLYWTLSATLLCLNPLAQAEDAYTADGTAATANVNLCDPKATSSTTAVASNVEDSSGIASPLLTGLCQSANQAIVNLQSVAPATTATPIIKSAAHLSFGP